jgi:aspartyl-tRNA(Asn)/glutamyl-tRNA(Gln) amidotransferase subunit A
VDTRDLSAAGTVAAIRRGELTCEQATADALARIDAEDSRCHAFLSVPADRALARARALDRAPLADAPLFGVPVAIKDNICTRGLTTTAGSRMLAGWTAPYDAAVVERLEAAGAVIVGKTNCDEFAMGSSTEHSAFGPTRNPWDPSRTPGGSSGGSAAAVAAGMVPLALGSDTGGSVRQPAALCGIAGGKPTYGRVSRYGLIAFASSLDQIGPFARSIRDLALLQDVIDGGDPRDATCDPRDRSACSSGLDAPVRAMTLGVPRHRLAEGVDDEVRASFEDAIDVYRGLGARIVDVALPHSRFAIPVYYLVATAEASSNLARYDGIRYGLRVPGTDLGSLYAQTRSAGFGEEVKRRIMLGTYALSAGYYDAFYAKAQQVRELIRADFEAALSAADVLLLPTSPTPAFALGERMDDPLQMYLADVFTVGPSLAGLPAVSVPCGLTAGRLPVGLQITGRAWEDAAVFRVAAALERERPPLGR